MPEVFPTLSLPWAQTGDAAPAIPGVREPQPPSLCHRLSPLVELLPLALVFHLRVRRVCFLLAPNT